MEQFQRYNKSPHGTSATAPQSTRRHAQRLSSSVPEPTTGVAGVSCMASAPASSAAAAGAESSADTVAAAAADVLAPAAPPAPAAAAPSAAGGCCFCCCEIVAFAVDGFAAGGLGGLRHVSPMCRAPADARRQSSSCSAESLASLLDWAMSEVSSCSSVSTAGAPLFSVLPAPFSARLFSFFFSLQLLESRGARKALHGSALSHSICCGQWFPYR